MFKRAAVIALVVVLFVVMFTFTALNTGQVELDLGFLKRTFPISMTLAATFVFGMICGMLCMTAFVFKMISERRVLRRSLRMSEAEVSSLRNLPLSDAD